MQTAPSSHVEPEPGAQQRSWSPPQATQVPPSHKSSAPQTPPQQLSPAAPQLSHLPLSHRPAVALQSEPFATHESAKQHAPSEQLSSGQQAPPGSPHGAQMLPAPPPRGTQVVPGSVQVWSSQQVWPRAPQGSGAPRAPPESVLVVSSAPPNPASAPTAPASPLLPPVSAPAELEVVLVDTAGVPPLPVRVVPVVLVLVVSTNTESSPPQAANRTKPAAVPRTKAAVLARKRMLPLRTRTYAQHFLSGNRCVLHDWHRYVLTLRRKTRQAV